MRPLALATASEVIGPARPFVLGFAGVRRGSAKLIVANSDKAMDAVVGNICKAALTDSSELGPVAVIDLDLSAKELGQQFEGLQHSLLDRLLLAVRPRRAAAPVSTEATASDAYLAVASVIGSHHKPGLTIVRLRTTQAVTVKTLAITSAIFKGLARTKLAAIVVAISGATATQAIELMRGETDAVLLVRGEGAQPAMTTPAGVAVTLTPESIGTARLGGSKRYCCSVQHDDASSSRPVRLVILDVLKSVSPDLIGPGEIASRGGVAGTAVRAALAKLVASGTVFQASRGRYGFAARPEANL